MSRECDGASAGREKMHYWLGKVSVFAVRPRALAHLDYSPKAKRRNLTVTSQGAYHFSCADLVARAPGR